MHTAADPLAATAKTYHGGGIGPYVLGAAVVLAFAIFPLARRLRAGRGGAYQRLGTTRCGRPMTVRPHATGKGSSSHDGSDPERAGRAPAGRYRFRNVLRMEWVKLRSLRSTAWALLLGVVAVMGIAIAAGFNTRNAHGDVTSNLLVGIALGQVVFGVLGVLAMTGEYSTGTIHSALAAIPRRSLLLAAKAAVFGVAVFAGGELAAFGAFGVGVAFVRHGVPHPALSQPGVLRAVALTGAYLGLIGLIGLGLGAIIRHGAAAIATLVTIVFAAPLAGLAQTPLGRFLPELIAGNSLSATQPATQAGMLPPWAGIGVICGYALILLAAGGWLLTRRDA